MQPQVNWQSSKIFVQTQQDFDEVEPLLRIQPQFSSHHHRLSLSGSYFIDK